MITITLEEADGLERTHFKNLSELMSFLNRPAEGILSEKEKDLNSKLNKRYELMDTDPSQISSVQEAIEYARKGE